MRGGFCNFQQAEALLGEGVRAGLHQVWRLANYDTTARHIEILRDLLVLELNAGVERVAVVVDRQFIGLGKDCALVFILVGVEAALDRGGQRR